jgi:two-component system response regulator AtoC
MPSLQLLIIDDEPAIRQILSKIATDAGHTVSIAADGKGGLERLAKGDIDVALCDIRMPEISGIEVVEKARQQGIDTLFLMMTAYASVCAMRIFSTDWNSSPTLSISNPKIRCCVI